MNNQGQQIPKATMTSYLKEKLGKTKISTEFTEGILYLAKEYVSRVANKANEICTNENKKTISLDHLYQSISHYKLTKQMPELKKVEKGVKQEVSQKHEMRLRMQRSYDEDRLEQLREQQLILSQLGGDTLTLVHQSSAPVSIKDTVNPNLFQNRITIDDDEEYEVESGDQDDDGNDEVQEIENPGLAAKPQ